MNGLHVSDAELHAYVDGQLDPARQAAVEQHLASDAGAAARVAAYRQLNTLLHDRYDPVAEAPVPHRLVFRSPRRLPWRVAAAVGWLAFGGLLGAGAVWQFGPGTSLAQARIEATLARPAGIAHAVYTPEVRHPVEVVASEEAHLVGWLTKRLGARVRAPRLDDLGYQLVGGRLLPAVDDGPAAQLMYQDATGTRLTLYLRGGVAGSETTAFHFADEGGVGVFYWIDGPFGYALSATLPRADLLPLAHAVYAQLNP